MKLKRGDIVLLRFPFTDLSGDKVRPALVISDDSFNRINNDAVFLPITSKFYRSAFDYQLKTNNNSFPDTGLKVSSTFRTAKLMSLEQKSASRLLRKADNSLMCEINKRLKLLFDL